ncbi:MAG: VWA domain-containing protein [Acidobacteriota bacterium]|jgi:VWFA-related protein
MRRVFLVGVALLGGPSAGSQDLPVFTSSVEMVRLDVSVTRDGRPVKGLTGRDFEVRDNGVLQEAEVVGQEERPVHAVLALDNSASLGGDRLGRLKVAAHSLLEVLRPDDAVSLLTFSHRLELKALPGASREEVHEAIEATEAQLTTALYDATFAALTMADPSLGRPVVLVFTDGEDVGSWIRPEQVLRAASTSDLVSHAVMSGKTVADVSFLEKLATATGGEVWRVEELEVEGAFLAAVEEFRARYTLQYAVPYDARERWHDIEVRLRVSGVEVRAREGYLNSDRQPDEPRRVPADRTMGRSHGPN